MQENDQVWIKLKGYPWWPAIVLSLNDSKVTPAVHEERDGEDTIVMFYGDYQLYISLKMEILTQGQELDSFF